MEIPLNKQTNHSYWDPSGSPGFQELIQKCSIQMEKQDLKVVTLRFSVRLHVSSVRRIIIHSKILAINVLKYKTVIIGNDYLFTNRQW